MDGLAVLLKARVLEVDEGGAREACDEDAEGRAIERGHLGVRLELAVERPEGAGVSLEPLETVLHIVQSVQPIVGFLWASRLRSSRAVRMTSIAIA